MKHFKMVLINLGIFIAGYLIYEMNVWFYNLGFVQSVILLYVSTIISFMLSVLFNINDLRGKK